MNVLVYGSNGWIGKQVTNYMKNNNIFYVEGKSRCDNIKEVETELEQINPTHVISLIGRTYGGGCNNIDYLEDNLSINIRDNLFSPFILAKLCDNKHIHFTYLGTGCIFNGSGFTEDSLPNYFGSGYSLVKGYTDRVMKTFDNCLNLRIRMPISSEPHKRNFITKLTSYEKICSITNSMTVLDDFIPIILDMMMKENKGTINLTNPGSISHNEILDMYKEIVDNSFVYKNFTKEEQDKILTSDRSNNVLCTDKLESLYKVDDIKTSVEKCLIRYNLNLNK